MKLELIASRLTIQLLYQLSYTLTFVIMGGVEPPTCWSIRSIYLLRRVSFSIGM